MTEQAQNLQQQTQEDQYLQEAQSFYGQVDGPRKEPGPELPPAVRAVLSAASRGRRSGPDPGDDSTPTRSSRVRWIRRPRMRESRTR